MFRRTILMHSAVLAASVFLSYERVEAGKPVPPPTTGPRYLLEWVAQEAIHGVKWSQPRGINSSGDAVGLACWPNGKCGVVDPVWGTGDLWEVFLYKASNGSVTNLNVIAAGKVLAGWRLIDAEDINDMGQIVGSAEYRFRRDDGTIAQDWGAFLYTPNSVTGPHVRIFSTHSSDGITYSYSCATSINDNGLMILSQDYNIGGHPCVCSQYGNLVPLPPPSDGIGVWRANAINLSGQVAGNARIGESVNAVRYTPGIGTVSLGWLKSPGTDRLGQANDINDSGQVTGWTTTSGGTAGHAFRYTDGIGMKDLGALGTSSTKGFGINNAGHVVGDAMDGRAFVYMDRMVDLKAAIDNLPSEYALAQMRARKINNSGWILGSFGGDRGQACLLKPK